VIASPRLSPKGKALGLQLKDNREKSPKCNQSLATSSNKTAVIPIATSIWVRVRGEISGARFCCSATGVEESRGRKKSRGTGDRGDEKSTLRQGGQGRQGERREQGENLVKEGNLRMRGLGLGQMD